MTFVVAQGDALDSRVFWMQNETRVNNFKASVYERIANREMVSAEFTIEHFEHPRAAFTPACVGPHVADYQLN